MLDWLQSLPPALLLQRSGVAYLIVNALHIAFIGALAGAIVALDLRLLGLFKSIPLPTMGPFLSRYAATALVLAIITGVLLFSVQPYDYTPNVAFRVKLALIAAGVVNAVWLHAGPHWKQGVLQNTVSARVKAHAAVSICIWPAALLAGRWIAFV